MVSTNAFHSTNLLLFLKLPCLRLTQSETLYHQPFGFFWAGLSLGFLVVLEVFGNWDERGICVCVRWFIASCCAVTMTKTHTLNSAIFPQVVDIVVYCLDQRQLKEKGMTELFPGLCRYVYCKYCRISLCSSIIALYVPVSLWTESRVTYHEQFMCFFFFFHFLVLFDVMIIQYCNKRTCSLDHN